MLYIPDNAQQSYYALSFLYNEKFFNRINRDKFIEIVNNNGALEIDAPNTTCPLNKYSIFQNKNITKDLILELPNAYKYHSKVFKMPTWYGEDRFKYAEFYLNVIKDFVKNYHI